MTKGLNKHDGRVLAIRPTGRGFGFVVLESPDLLLDWGYKETRLPDSSHLMKQTRFLLNHYAPDLLVIEDTGQSRRRSQRARDLEVQLTQMAAEEKIKSRLVKRRVAKLALGVGEFLTQFGLATEIAKRFPHLAPQLPPPRKPWMSQDSRFAIFEAVALALAAFPASAEDAIPSKAI